MLAELKTKKTRMESRFEGLLATHACDGTTILLAQLSQIPRLVLRQIS